MKQNKAFEFYNWFMDVYNSFDDNSKNILEESTNNCSILPSQIKSSIVKIFNKELKISDVDYFSSGLDSNCVALYENIACHYIMLIIRYFENDAYVDKAGIIIANNFLSRNFNIGRKVLSMYDINNYYKKYKEDDSLYEISNLTKAFNQYFSSITKSPIDQTIEFFKNYGKN